MRYRTIAVIICSLACLALKAQQWEGSEFVLFNTKQGLSHNYITGIQQDPKGFIWISTKRGLNRFDGINFKQFLSNTNPIHITGNAISSIRMLDKDHLAVSSESGADIINTENLSVIKLKIPSDSALEYWSNSFRYMERDGNGNYVASTKTGLYVFSREGKTIKRYDHYSPEEIGKSWMMFGGYLHPNNGCVLQESQVGLLIYNPERNRIMPAAQHYPQLRAFINEQKQSRDRFLFVNPSLILLFNTITNSLDLVDVLSGVKHVIPSPIDLLKHISWQSQFLQVDENSWVFNAKDKGLIYFTVDPVNKKIKLDPEKKLENYLCTTMHMDKQKRLWVGTDEGLLMQKHKQEIINSFPFETPGYEPGFEITVIYPLEDILAAGTNQYSVYLIDKKKKSIVKTITLDKSNPPNLVTSFLRIHPDTLLIGTTGGLYWMHTRSYRSGKKKLEIQEKDNKVRDMYRDRTGKIWITCYSINKVFVFDHLANNIDSIETIQNPNFNINLINSVAEDKIGNIWMGGDAIARWNRSKGKVDSLITILPTQKNNKKGFSVLQNSKGDIWATINDDGLARIFPLPVKHIRPDNFVIDYSKETYPFVINDRILAPTLTGFGLLNTNTGKSIILNEHDGIPKAMPTSFRFYLDTALNLLWYATNKMVHSFRANENLLKQNAPTLVFSELSVLQDTVIYFPLETVSLAYDLNDIRITLTAINYDDAANMRFAYRFLEDEDSKWVDMGTQQSILLTNVSPGSYKLQAKVYSFDNKFPETIAALSIVVSPPFWDTLWFYLLTGGLTVFIIYLLYRRHIKHVRQRAYLDQQLAETEMKALHSQMNPHFIFNCMNSIREMILNNENRDASNYLSKFAHLLRSTLENSTRPFISLKQTIDYLKRYLELEKIRTSHFSFTISLDETIIPEEVWLPPMLIQPLLENAIWHGAGSGKEMELSIRFQLEGEQIICIVEDDGIGINASLEQKGKIEDYNSYGIENIKQRIALLNEKHGLKSHIEIQDKAELYKGLKTGTRVILHLPVKKEYYGKRVTYDIG